MDLLTVPRSDTPFGLRRFLWLDHKSDMDYHMSYDSATRFRASSLTWRHTTSAITWTSSISLSSRASDCVFNDEACALNKFVTDTDTEGILCLACLLYAPDKVGVGNQSKLGVLVETPLTNFKKIREYIIITCLRRNITRTPYKR